MFSMIVSHMLLLFPMTSIDIPIKSSLLPLIFIKDSTHIGQLCKVMNTVIIYHHLYFWSKAIDKFHAFGPLPCFPLIIRKIPYKVLKPRCILCHRHTFLFQLEKLHLLPILHIFWKILLQKSLSESLLLDNNTTCSL